METVVAGVLVAEAVLKATVELFAENGAAGRESVEAIGCAGTEGTGGIPGDVRGPAIER